MKITDENRHDPETQARHIMENGGDCDGFWDCDNCHLKPYLPDDDCYTDIAYEAATDLLEEILELGRCDDIWRGEADVS